MGVGAAGELRISYRDRCRLAGAEPWRWPHAQILHRCVFVGSRRSQQGDRAPARTAAETQRERTRRERAQRGLYLRRLGPSRGADYPVWGGSSFHRARHGSTERSAGRHTTAMTVPNKRVAILSPVAWRTPPRQYGAWETVG